MKIIVKDILKKQRTIKVWGGGENIEIRRPYTMTFFFNRNEIKENVYGGIELPRDWRSERIKIGDTIIIKEV